MNSNFYKFILLSLLIIVITGCSLDVPKVLNDEQVTLKVMYYDEQQFFREYGELLYAKFPNIEIEVVTMQNMYNQTNSQDFDPKKALNDLLDQEKPDIIFTQIYEYEELVTDGRLMELDTWIGTDKYDLSTFVPAIIEQLRELGNGSLYGLAPRFYSTALFYNIDLFEQNGIDVPSEGMNWIELMQLAQRFPSGDEANRIYGFNVQEYSTYSQVLQMVARTEGLSFLDSESMKMTFDTESYRRIFQSVVELYQSGAINPPRDYNSDGMTPMVMEQDYLMQNPFVAGKSAMVVDSPQLIQQIEQANQRVKDYKAFNYGILTAPTSSTEPGMGGQINIGQIYAVSSTSENSKAAWELVKYINSEDMARIKSKSSTYDLSTRLTFSKERDGHSMEPFYAMKPSPINAYNFLEGVPNSFYQSFDMLLNEQIKKVVNKEATLEEAIQVVQEQGQKDLENNLLLDKQEKQQIKERSGDAIIPEAEETLETSSQ
ncbi:MAG: extracellular solute-binding protein [Paenibacillaceae bacterium]